MPRPCAPKSGFSTSGVRASSRAAISSAAARALDGECRRRRQAGILEQERRHRLVDAALDRLRGIPHRHGKPAKRMQHAETPRDRLERSRGDRADEHRVRQSCSKPGIASPAGRSVSKAIAASGAVASHRAAPAQLVRKPFGARVGIVADDEDARDHRRRSSGLSLSTRRSQGEKEERCKFAFANRQRCTALRLILCRKTARRVGEALST